MNISLKNRHAFIGGSSQGIGYAIAHKMAECGASITLTGRNGEKLKEIVKNLPKKTGQKHDFKVLDFSDLKKLEKFLPKYVAETAAQPVSILVLNSGGPVPNSAYKATPPQYLDYFNAAIMASQMLTQAFVPAMQAQHWGRIISVLSSTVKQPRIDLGISNTIRAGMANWSKSLAMELGKDGITVNNLLTGLIFTERLESLIDIRMKNANLDRETVVKQMAATIPAGHIGQPEDMANVAAFLASDFAAYVNGVNLPVDGGLLGTL
jgi:3-oxoacyl-[acyl-carrier protein] reductase